MARKRKGVGSVRGAKKKQGKVPQKKPDDYDLLAIKISAKTAVRPEFHDVVIPWIAKKSIEATKICELASLLFLNKVRAEFEVARITGNWTFFDGDGEHVIEGCFFAVLAKNKENEDMLPEFRDTFEHMDAENRMAWPNNNYMGNIFKYLFQQYIRNVTTNLTTHRKNRLRQYFKFVVVLNEEQNIDDRDINNAINWAIKRYDSTRGSQERINKRAFLLDQVRLLNGPDDDDISRFTKDEWFASLPMWLAMQAHITAYNDWLQQQAREVIKKSPTIKNISVIPICSHQRTNIKIDADVLYRMLCETKLIPKYENGTQVSMEFISRNRQFYFAQYFNMDKINRLLKTKEFHFHIVSDGISVSILYKVPKRLIQALSNDDLVKKRYMDGFYVYELGIDPGMKTWLAVVRRYIDTGKEVCIVVFNF